jgi:sugar/nucleoside kinase (ribokinase family)
MPDGRVKIAASPSAALELNEEDIDEDIIRQAKVVVLDGFMLNRRKLVCYILELASQYGTAVALDVSTTGLAEERAVEIVTYARAYPLILFMNEDESRAFYRALSQKKDFHENDKNDGLTPDMVRLFQDFTAQDVFPIVVVKLGRRGAVVFAGGNVYREETIPVIPLETTGAGDAFSAAFLAAWIRDRSLGECAALGNKAAREVLDVKGTQLDPSALKYLEKELR